MASLVVAEVVVGVAEAVPGVRPRRAVADLAEQGEGLPAVASACWWSPSWAWYQPTVLSALACPARWPAASEQVERPLRVVERPPVAALPLGRHAEVELGAGLAGRVAELGVQVRGPARRWAWASS